MRSRTRVSQPGLSPSPPQWPCTTPVALPTFLVAPDPASTSSTPGCPQSGKGKSLDLVLLLNSSLSQSPAMVPTLVPTRTLPTWFRDNHFTTETKFWILRLCLKSDILGDTRGQICFPWKASPTAHQQVDLRQKDWLHPSPMGFPCPLLSNQTKFLTRARFTASAVHSPKRKGKAVMLWAGSLGRC